MKRQYKLLLLMSFILCNCIAQNNFKYQTFTDSVVKDGFYQINLLPEIVAKCCATLHDIRLLNMDENQIPYLIKNGTYYFAIPKPIINQKDSGKISFVTLIYDANYKIDKFQLFAVGAPFFERHIYFDERYYDTYKNPEFIVISSKSSNIFFLHLSLKKNTVKFMVENNDNPPLKIDSVKAYQNAYAIFAYLKAGQKYKLVFGNDSLAAPVYDIAAFSDSIKNATLLPTGEITENKFAQNKPSTPKLFNNKIWLWTAIICALLLLLYFTSSMLKQINKR